MHPARLFPFAPERVEPTCRAERTLPGHPDIQDTSGSELHLVYSRQIKMSRMGNCNPKTAYYFGTDLIAAYPDRRTDRRPQVPRICLPADTQSANSRRYNTCGRSAPTCMDCRNNAGSGIDQQDWNAIGGFHPHKQALPIRNQRIAFAKGQRSILHNIGMNLLRHCYPFGVGRASLSESVDQAFQAGEIGRGNHARDTTVGLLYTCRKTSDSRSAAQTSRSISVSAGTLSVIRKSLSRCRHSTERIR